MTFSTAIILSVVWLLISALLGGLIVYFLMLSRVKSEKKVSNKPVKDDELSDQERKKIEEEWKLKVKELQEKLKNYEKKYLQLEKDCEEKQDKLKAEINEQQLLLDEKDKIIETKELQKIIESSSQQNEVNDEDSKKQAELDKIRAKAKEFDYSTMGVASAEQKDDLKLISGIGPFIEEKLNALGIYTFEQISKFTELDVEHVTEAIEFFPGRIQRDKWIEQAKERVENIE